MVNECSCQTAQISIKYGRVVPKFFEQRAVLNDIVFSYSWGVGGGRDDTYKSECYSHFVGSLGEATAPPPATLLGMALYGGL